MQSLCALDKSQDHGTGLGVSPSSFVANLNRDPKAPNSDPVTLLGRLARTFMPVFACVDSSVCASRFFFSTGLLISRTKLPF